MIGTTLLHVLFFVVVWGKWMVVGGYMLAVIAKYIRKEKGVGASPMSWWSLHGIYLASLAAWILSVGIAQYFTWESSAITGVFATSAIPDQVHLIGLSALLVPLRHFPHMYLVYTLFMKVIAPLIWQLGVVGVLVFVLGLAEKKRSHLFSIDEVHLLIAACFISGWPGVLIIVPLFFGVFLVHAFYGLARGLPRTQIGFSAAICLFVGLMLRLKIPAMLWIFGT